MRKFLKIIVDIRIFILAVLGISLYVAISKYQISLWYILGGGILTGIIFGKVLFKMSEVCNLVPQRKSEI